MRRRTWPNTSLIDMKCKKCKVFVCKASDVYSYSLSCNTQYVVPNEALSGKYDRVNHDEPEVSEDFVKPYKMYCLSQNCRSQWGVIGLWRDTGYTFPVLKCDKFLFSYNRAASKTFKKWGDVWFEIPSIQDWPGFEDDIIEEN